MKLLKVEEFELPIDKYDVNVIYENTRRGPVFLKGESNEIVLSILGLKSYVIIPKNDFSLNRYLVNMSSNVPQSEIERYFYEITDVDETSYLLKSAGCFVEIYNCKSYVFFCSDYIIEFLIPGNSYWTVEIDNDDILKVINFRR